ncbi:Multidrug resistance protein NorM [Aquicella siphonis]|uniref:Multidrug-efflux transporter n=1 Tax=Aquicella siphonis TaxID=254247 RepID=A0A5E4PES1_9COXI|nr:MATE family efflux transporter [Aquicella siphonis]VVC74988.1 Multidrug resistance protein NorM [Aquicella siphonis]
MIKTHEIKSTFTLVLPLMAAFLAQKGMQFIDTLMMGWLGPSALAAGALGTGLFITTLVFCLGTLSAVGVFIARAKGADDSSDIQSSLQHGICLALLLSIPCMALIWFMPPILAVIGQNQQVVDNVTLLLHGLVWGLPGFLLFFVFREFISAFALTKTVMIVALGSIPLTFIMNYVLIYGKYGFPQLGIAGIGFAGGIVMWFMFACLLLFSKKHFLIKEYVSFKGFRFRRDKIIDMLFIGVPSGSLFILESGMFLSAATLMGYFGVDSLAAYQVALQWASIAYSIPFAMSMATALQISHALGEKNPLKAKRIAFFNLGLGVVFSAIVAIIFILFPEAMVKIFLYSGETQMQETRLAVSFLTIAAIFQCMDAVQGIANGALRGYKDTLIPMLLSSGCYWFLGVGSAYYLSFHTRLQATGIWYGLTIGICSVGVVLTPRLLKRIQYEKQPSCEQPRR